MNRETIAFLLTLFVMEILMLTVHFRLAGNVLLLSMFVSIVYAFSRKMDRMFMISWMVSVAPVVVFIRSTMISESVYAIMTVLIGVLSLLTMRKQVERVIYNKNILFIIAFFLLYIAIGLVEGIKPIKFMKVVEFGTTLMLISMLLYSPEHRGFALRNFVFSSIAVYIVAFPNIANRYATPTELGWTIGGDPSSMAALLLISLILLLFDGGKILKLNNQPKTLLALTMVVFILLLLSTSRTNMISMLIILLFYAFKNRVNFLKYLAIVLVLFTVSLTYLSDQYFDTIEKFYVKKLDVRNRTLNQVTTARFVQWQVGMHYFDVAPLSEVLFGYGPARADFLHEKGKDYVRVYGYIDGAEHHYAIHTLYLQLAVEYGLIAFSIFIFVLLKSLYKNFLLYLKGREVLFYYTIGYMFSIMGNSGMSVIGGVYMAFIFAGSRIFNEHYLRQNEKLKI